MNRMPAPVAYEELLARYRGVVEAAVDAIIIIDETGMVEIFNPAAERTFGYSAAEVVGRNVNMLMPPHDAAHHDGYLRHYLDGGAPRIIGIGREVVGRRKSGECFPMDLAVGEIEGLVPRRFVGTIRDITTRRALEDALRQREQEHSQLLDHAPIGIFAAALGGRFVRVNPALCRMVGYSEAELVTLSAAALAVEDDREQIERSLAELTGAAKQDCQCTLRWRRRDGETINVSLHAVLVGDAPERIIGQVLDRTEQVRSEEASRDARARLAHAGRVSTLGEMASAIAHEINQPLTAISAYAQACRRILDQPGHDPAVVVEALEAITTQALRAGDVVRRIRGFVSNRESEREECDFNEIVQAALDFATIDLRANQVRLHVDLAEGLPTVLADPVQIQQVCLNLLRNAIDAMLDLPPAARHLAVTTAATPHGAVVRVADSGPGVDAEMRERLFQPFQTTKAEGMGMGLSISSSIVGAHGGTIRYADAEQGGAVFSVEIPQAVEHA